ncbi:TonB-dependent siderophore receptor [Variovorax sp. 770b2]|uniref:TonB-dependent siderophore receptor n=1 Tax=Variovorax sp. 770b2 TaxID=1566271 RepID=UPI0008F419CB|nr:TonB-dependent siderophore receptor [Variovorax sp. 770b2]SFQ33206.1 iron complex outermembrane recepter protein [Variovorax sp. 770b2]
MRSIFRLQPLAAAVYAAGLGFGAGCALAQSSVRQSLPPVTVSADHESYLAPESATATRTETPSLQSPQSTQVVPLSVIQDQSALNLGDALRNVAGVQSDFGFNGSAQPLAILRGFPSISMTAMGSMSGSSTYYIDGSKVAGVPINMANVQSVEVIKGPSSVLYGRAEPGGLINVVTKPIGSMPAFSLEQTLGHYGLSRTSIEASGPVNTDGTVRGRAAASYYSANSIRDYVTDKLGAITASLAWVPDSHTSVTATIDYSNQRYRTDYGVPAVGNRPANLPWSRQFNDSPALSGTKTSSFSLEGTHQLSDAWQIKAKMLSVRGDTSEVDVTPYRLDVGAGMSPGDNCLGSGNPMCRYYFYARPKGKYKLDQFNIDFVGKFDTGGVRHTVLVGFDTYTSRKSGTTYFQQLSAVDIYSPLLGATPRLDTALSSPLDVRDQNRWTSAYVQDQLAFGNGVFLTGALRHDRTSAVYASDASTSPNTASFTTPRLGVVWQFAPNQAVYAQYQDAVSANNGRDSVTQEALKAEKASQIEIGHKIELLDGKFSSTVALYQLVKRNRGGSVPIDTAPYYNTVTIGKARSRGLEWDVSGEITKRLSLIASYAYTDTKVTEDPTYQGKQLANVAHHTASLWARYAFDSQWSGGAGVFAQSRRQGDVGNTFQLPGYARVDAMLAYRFVLSSAKAALQFNIDNLFGKKYYTASHQFVSDWIKLGTPRTAKLTLRLDY